MNRKILTGMLFMLSAVSFFSCGNGSAFSDGKFLHTEGRDIMDKDGNLVNLRGVNVGGCLLQEFWMTPTIGTATVHAESDIYAVLDERFGKKGRAELVDVYQKAYFGESDFERLESLGANCIRLPFWWRNIADENGKLEKNAFKTLDWFVDNAAKHGMYVILDMHGLPGSQNGSDHSGVDGLKQKKEASEFFFGDNAARNQEIYYQLWQKIASHYRGNPAVAGYDIMNEPYCTYRYNSGLTDYDLHKLLWDIYDETYRVIRKADKDHIIILEATWDPVDLPAPDDYGWENVVYEYHNYLYSDENNSGGNQIKNMQNKLNLIARADYNVPAYMGEFSYFKNLDAWDEGLKLLTDAGLSWTLWTYKTLPSCGNWGLVHHVPSVGGINVEYLEKDELASQWSRVGEISENTGLMEVFSKYAMQDAVPYSLSK